MWKFGPPEEERERKPLVLKRFTKGRKSKQDTAIARLSGRYEILPAVLLLHE
jgi:hypothetical protein